MQRPEVRAKVLCTEGRQYLPLKPVSCFRYTFRSSLFLPIRDRFSHRGPPAPAAQAGERAWASSMRSRARRVLASRLAELGA